MRQAGAAAVTSAGLRAFRNRLSRAFTHSGGPVRWHDEGAVDEDRGVYEFGVYAHGSDAEATAARMVEQIRTWDRDHRHGPGVRLTVHPGGTPDSALQPGFVIDKRHTRMVLGWPTDADRVPRPGIESRSGCWHGAAPARFPVC